ncbi:hypothetical protein DM01DRAFT_1367959 [Hesseltinella vesiculosa]|uniref:Protein SCAI n=1 Tax=Hesseltinella vesiculosa TaxID=101127 RepID=A0A1X2GBH9_9FUNG|nr:hypothetical protein DM01DRAFT_1367959 [Hesseltinella vesiculosa]
MESSSTKEAQITAQSDAAAPVVNTSHQGTATTTSQSPAATIDTNTDDLNLASQTQSIAEKSADDAIIRSQRHVEEFQYLLEKSQSLFSGLRDLPPTGNYRQWRHYFEKTFEVYTNLWKFQQTHRALLEDKSNYGLKRWEVGEIASKIGQLYYHYYLRTSETNYLHEAYVFYEAIHDRQYFKNILEVKNPALMIKKMRYYARFIVVCLLLNKEDNLKLLVSDLEILIDEYSRIFKATDGKEWQLVLHEITSFMDAERKLIPINAERHQVPFERRLGASFTSPLTVPHPPLQLQEVILVGGNFPQEIKFSELTLDMYRMLQSLEREPSTVLINDPPASAQPSHDSEPSQQDPPEKTAPLDPKKDMHNPHKCLLYRPTLSQLMVYLSTAFKDTDANAAMLVYLSSPGCTNVPSRGFGVTGGVAMYQKKPTLSSVVVPPAANHPNTNVSATAMVITPSSASATPAAGTASVSTTASVTTTATTTNANPAPADNNPSTSNTPSATVNANPGTATPSSSSAPVSSQDPSHPNPQTQPAQAGALATTSALPPSTTSALHAKIVTPGSSSSPLPTNTASSSPPSVSQHQQQRLAPATSAAPPAAQACLYPADLIPWTRKPLCLIIDSDNSTAFYQAIPNLFDQPVLTLLSPTQYPSTIQEKREIGSLFTLFLHTPLLGFCSVSDIGNLDHEKWDLCVQKVAQLEQTIGQRLLDHPDLHPYIKCFMEDAFLWTFIVRFVMCGVILRCHSSFKHEKSYPCSTPDMPESIYLDTSVMALFNELIVLAGVSTYFSLPSTTPTAAPMTSNPSNALETI